LVNTVPHCLVSGSSINMLPMTVPSATAAATAVLMEVLLKVFRMFFHFVMLNWPSVVYRKDEPPTIPRINRCPLFLAALI
jgi:hypothetical protein